MISVFKSKKERRIKKVMTILLALCMIISQMVIVNAYQADRGDGTFNSLIMYADYPDPSIVRVGNYFYLASSTFVNSPGLVILKSEDLVNWEIAGHCMDVLTGADSYNMTGTIKYAGGCFAPSIAYKDDTFYVIVNMNDGQRTRIYYAKDVAGPWKYNELGGSYFDPALFIDTDGTSYVVYGGAFQNKISMIQLNSTLSATTGSSRTILAYNNVEGSHLVKAKGKYYLFNAVPAQRLVCSRASSVWGPYGETTTLCTAGKGGHQGGIVDLPDGSYWGYLHQDDGAIGRPTRICPITWQNGWPMFGREGHIGTVESTYTKPIQDKPIKNPQASDEFNSTTLGLQWMWNHNPDNTKWSLTGTSLRLKATTASSFWNARNSLTQKGQGPQSSGTIKIDCSNMQAGDICGLGMLGDPRGYIAVTGNPKRIIMSEEDSVKATVSNITSNTLYFRIEMNFSNKLAKFFWKDSEEKSWQPLGTTITMGFDWQYGTFQGEQYAILNFNPSASTGYMDVDWFRLNDEPGPNGEPPQPISAFTNIEAEKYNGQSGIETETCTEGGLDIGFIENGDYAVYKNVDFDTGATGFKARVASNNANGGKIEIRLDSVTGTLIGTCPVEGTGGWQTWTDAKCSVSGVTGQHDVYLKFTGESDYLFNVNWFVFDKGSTTKVGDLNGDTFVDAMDFALLKMYLIKSIKDFPVENDLVAADLNGDKAIDALDFAVFKQYLLGTIKVLPYVPEN
ncbi:MAG TPA: carbohydrate-binding protein [Clostridia bacterium]|nr:carbohydrate-binding protein [Clostridia bacterium]